MNPNYYAASSGTKENSMSLYPPLPRPVTPQVMPPSSRAVPPSPKATPVDAAASARDVAALADRVAALEADTAPIVAAHKAEAKAKAYAALPLEVRLGHMRDGLATLAASLGKDDPTYRATRMNMVNRLVANGDFKDRDEALFALTRSES